MTTIRDLSAFVCLLALCAPGARADRSALQHIPDHCEVDVLIDMEALAADPQLAAVAQFLVDTFEGPGDEAPAAEAILSFAVGVDIPAGLNLMMPAPDAPEPTAYYAIQGKGPVFEGRTEADSTAKTIDKASGRASYTFENGNTFAFSEDFSLLVGSNESPLDWSKIDAQKGHPFLYVHVANVGEILGQAGSMGTIMLMQAGSTPEAKEHAQSAMRKIGQVQNIQLLELTVGIDGDTVHTSLRATMPDAEAAEEMRGLLQDLVKLNIAASGLPADAAAAYSMEAKGEVVVVAAPDISKEAFVTMLGPFME
jgi:hypothetical protein